MQEVNIEGRHVEKARIMQHFVRSNCVVHREVPMYTIDKKIDIVINRYVEFCREIFSWNKIGL